MKYIHIFFVALLLLIINISAYSQCCPSTINTGSVATFSYGVDDIELDVYTDNENKWLQDNEPNEPILWDKNVFIRVRAWSNRPENALHYMQFCFWVGSSDRLEALSKSYTNGIGPLEGDYKQENPYYGKYQYPIDAFYNGEKIYFWTFTSYPTTKPLLFTCVEHQYFFDDNYSEDMNADNRWFCPFSCYGSVDNVPIPEPTSNSYSSSHIASIDNTKYTISVEEGDGGNLFLRVWDANCGSQPRVVIGSKTAYTINTPVVGNGSVKRSSSCSQYYPGDVITLTPQPGNGKTCFKRWTGTDNNLKLLTDNGNGTYSLKMPNRNVSLTANFGDCTVTKDLYLTLCSCDVPYKWNGLECSETKTYTYKRMAIDGITDSITNLHLTVLTPTVEPLQEAVFCEGSSYDWKGHAGFSSLTEAKTYYDTVFYATTDSYGKRCPQYCYSLQLDMNPKKAVELDKTLCYAEAAGFWSVHTLDKPLPAESAVPVKITVSETTKSLLTGCDSTTTYNLTIYPASKGVDNRRVCAKDFALNGFSWYGTTYYSVPAVAPTHTLTNSFDCDSIVTLNLQLGKETQVSETVTLCHSVLPDFAAGQTYTYTFSKDNHQMSIADTAGVEKAGVYYVYRDTLRDIYGCDSVLYTLRARVSVPVVMPTEVRYRCAYDMMSGEDWYIEGWSEHNAKEKYEAMVDSGYYEDILKTYDGMCDSIIYSLRIIEYPSYKKYKKQFTDDDFTDDRIKLDTVYISKGSVFHCGDHDYSVAGDYEEKTTTIHGCDSIIVFHLEVLPDMGHVYDTVCEKQLPYSWHHDDGEDGVYTASGNYNYATQTAHATDSIAVLHLTVLSAAAMPVEKVRICSSASYDWSGHPSFTSLTKTGIYTDTAYYVYGCDSVYYTLDLTVMPAAIDSSYTRVVCPGETYSDAYFTGITSVGTYLTSVPFYGTACDSVVYTLTVKDDCSAVEALVAADTVCADDGMFGIEVNILSGKPERMDLLFSDKAHRVGLRDSTGMTLSDTKETVYIDMPVSATPEAYLRPDDYDFTISITDAFGRVTVHPAVLTVIYPSWLLMQRWKDVLMVQNENYNGGYIFSAISWEAGGRKVDGGGVHNGYLYVDGGLDPAVPYRAWLTRADDGKTLPTCDVYYTDTIDDTTAFVSDDVLLYARYRGDYRQVAVESTSSGEYVVYSSDGKLLFAGRYGSRYHSPDILFPASVAQGIYLIRFTTDSGSIITKKWQLR